MKTLKINMLNKILKATKEDIMKGKRPMMTEQELDKSLDNLFT